MLHALETGRAIGNLAQDAHIAALALEHGARELWTADRDFTRFAGLKVHNPFLDPAVHERTRRYRTQRAVRRRP